MVAVLTAAMVVTGWGDWVQSLLFVVPLALIYARKMPGNRWHLDPRVRELADLGITFRET